MAIYRFYLLRTDLVYLVENWGGKKEEEFNRAEGREGAKTGQQCSTRNKNNHFRGGKKKLREKRE